MVNYQARQLNAVFGALADPTRRAILARLAGGEAMVTDLAGPFAMSLPAVSKHLAVLERAGLITRQREGRVRRCHLITGSMREAERWISKHRRFWEQQFDQLSRYLTEPTSAAENPPWQPGSSRPSPSGSRGLSRRRRTGSSRRGPGPKS